MAEPEPVQIAPRFLTVRSSRWLLFSALVILVVEALLDSGSRVRPALLCIAVVAALLSLAAAVWSHRVRLLLDDEALVLEPFRGEPRIVARRGEGKVVALTIDGGRWLIWFDGSGRPSWTALEGWWRFADLDHARHSLDVRQDILEGTFSFDDVERSYPGCAMGRASPS